MSRPFCVGLTGGIGSGKSLAARHLEGFGAEVIDTDVIARRLTGPGGEAMAAIAAAFGTSMLQPDGSLDRARMRELVFSEPAARQRLEAILHPLIRIQAAQELEACRAAYAVLVVPLLIETGSYAGLIDRVLVVDCPEATQIERAVARDGATRAAVAAIMRSQASRSQRLAVADDVLDNTGDPSHLSRQVEALHRKYLALAAKIRP